MRLLWDGICMGADLSYRAPLFYYKRRRCTDRLYWMCQYEAELRTYCMRNFSWVFVLMHLNFYKTDDFVLKRDKRKAS